MINPNATLEIYAQAYAAAWLWKPRVEVGERIDAILGAQVVGEAVGEPEDASEGKVRTSMRANGVVEWGLNWSTDCISYASPPTP